MLNKYLKWLSSSTKSIYWHDGAAIPELDEALGNGAVGATTNPFLIHSALKAQPGYWAPFIKAEAAGMASRYAFEQMSGRTGTGTGAGAGIKEIQRISDLDGDIKAEELTRIVASHVAGIVSQFRSRGAGKGYCCAQVNPNKPGNAEAMMEQALRYAKWAPNIVVKLPATKAGLEVFEECAARGINVASTVSFTVAQVLAAGEAFRKGAARARKEGIAPGLGIAVIMVGRLDDYLRDVMQDSSKTVTEDDVIKAGTVVFKRAYNIFIMRGYECMLMPAGCRGGYHITSLAGADAIMSIAPKIASALTDVSEPFTEYIDEAADTRVLGRLMGMPEFIKAYEPDGMARDAFITYGPTNRTLAQFCESGWNLLKAMNI